LNLRVAPQLNSFRSEDIGFWSIATYIEQERSGESLVQREVNVLRQSLARHVHGGLQAETLAVFVVESKVHLRKRLQVGQGLVRSGVEAELVAELVPASEGEAGEVVQTSHLGLGEALKLVAGASERESSDAREVVGQSPLLVESQDEVSVPQSKVRSQVEARCALVRLILSLLDVQLQLRLQRETLGLDVVEDQSERCGRDAVERSRSWDVDLEERVDPARPGLMEAKVEVTSKFLLLDLE
jgi:hypothetical protein